MTEKTCTTCGKSLPLTEFHKSKTGKHGVTSVCRACHAEKCHKYEMEHKQSRRTYHRAWLGENRAHRNKLQRAYVSERYKNDPVFRAVCRSGNIILVALASNGRRKTCEKTRNMLGCTALELQQYLGVRPGPDYTIDHICPMNVAKTEEEVYKLNHYSNLRWLSRKENRDKAHFWTPEGARLCLQLLGREWEKPTEES